MNLKYKIIFCAITLSAVFFAGRLSAPRPEVQTVAIQREEKQKVNSIDTKQEVKKVKSNKHKNKIKLTEKKPDGSEKTLEIISNESNEVTGGQILKLSTFDSEARTTEKIELKTPQERLTLVLFGSVEIPTTYTMQPLDFDSIKNHDAYFGCKLSFRASESLWLSAGAKQYTTENRSAAIVELEHRTKIW